MSDSWKGELLLILKCGVCGESIHEYEDLENGPEPEDEFQYTATRMDNGVMCDVGDSKQCGKYYHPECFDLHECPVHSKKVI